MEEDKPKVSFVLGGPGTGKGTMCSLLIQKFPHLVHLSAGELLRKEMSTQSEVATLISDYIKEGKIVPVKITCGLLKKAMKDHGWNEKEFLVDGFPRNQDNYDGWMAEIGDDAIIRQVIVLDCSEEIMTQRLIKRGESSGRSDDNLESIMKRFTTFKQETMPIIKFYEKIGILKLVDASGTIEENFERVKALFE